MFNVGSFFLYCKHNPCDRMCFINFFLCLKVYASFMILYQTHVRLELFVFFQANVIFGKVVSPVFIFLAASRGSCQASEYIYTYNLKSKAIYIAGSKLFRSQFTILRVSFKWTHVECKFCMRVLKIKYMIYSIHEYT